jgi:hypothetical protein
MRRIALLTTLVFLAGNGCSSDEEASAGGTCGSSDDCAGGICAVSQDFPSGYCTQGCELGEASSCPSGSVCIDDVSGVPASANVTAICYRSCQTTADCARAEFECLEKANELVCRNGN